MRSPAEVRAAAWTARGLSPLARLWLVFVLEHIDADGYIPPAPVVAAHFDVKRQSITRAMRRTVQAGWIEIRRMKGKRIRIIAAHIPRPLLPEA